MNIEIKELIALLISVTMGTGAYIGFQIIKKQQKISMVFIFCIITINVFVTYVASEILKTLKMGEYRSLTLPVVAYIGQYLMEWFDKRHLKLFDKGAEKLGIDLKNDENEAENKPE